MSLKLNLVVEKPDINDEFEYIEEEVDRNSPSNLYIKGPYMMAEGVNRNNRMYPLDELVREAKRYNDSQPNKNNFNFSEVSFYLNDRFSLLFDLCTS